MLLQTSSSHLVPTGTPVPNNQSPPVECPLLSSSLELLCKDINHVLFLILTDEGNACIINGIGTYDTTKQGNDATNLLLILLLSVIFLGGSGGTLALDASSTSSTIGGGEGEVNVLLRVETDNERRNVDNLLADTVKD